MSEFDFYKRPKIGIFDIEIACQKNRVICHPDDYKKLAESGAVEALTKGGVEVVSTNLAEKGKQIVTGDLACAVLEKWRVKQ